MVQYPSHPTYTSHAKTSHVLALRILLIPPRILTLAFLFLALNRFHHLHTQYTNPQPLSVLSRYPIPYPL